MKKRNIVKILFPPLAYCNFIITSLASANLFVPEHNHALRYCAKFDKHQHGFTKTPSCRHAAVSEDSAYEGYCTGLEPHWNYVYAFFQILFPSHPFLL